MKPMQRLIYGGLSLIGIYIVFLFYSIIQYPGGINPLEDYISYLGDFGKNPSGALMYNIGCVMTGILMLVFFSGFDIWQNPPVTPKKNISIIKFIGTLDSIALMLVGVFPNGNDLHGTRSSIFFFTNLSFLLSIILILYKHPNYNTGLALFGVIVVIFNATYVIVGGGPIVEWLTVFTALGYVGLIVLNVKKKF